ncbi:hypothetical protein DXV76_12770 [Rhodobacteraceae bacterium CCMM004]|nr:hypothetical protein DXV76_12770 [Rhodobacteraceae bacterium CCMM004]
MIRAIDTFLRRDTQGTTSVEAALALPPLIFLFMTGAEMGIIQMQQVMMERGMDIVVRDLRLGDQDLRDPIKMKQAVCDEILLAPGCVDDLMLEMGPVDVPQFGYTEGSMACVDRTGQSNPVISYLAGSDNEMMLMRFCLLYDPVLPSFGLGAVLPKEPGGGYALTASTFFVNEPS